MQQYRAQHDALRCHTPQARGAGRPWHLMDLQVGSTVIVNHVVGRKHLVPADIMLHMSKKLWSHLQTYMADMGGF